MYMVPKRCGIAAFSWTLRVTRANCASLCLNVISCEDIPEVTPTLIRKLLLAYKMSYHEGFTCYIVTCPLCRGVTKTNYINKNTGMFMCGRCKSTGSWNDFQEALTRSTLTEEQNVDEIANNIELQKSINSILENTIPLTDQKTLEDFHLPVVPIPHLESIRARLSTDGNALYFPLENGLSEVVGFRCIRRDSSGDTLDTTFDKYGGLFTVRMQKSQDIAILVPFITDVFALATGKLGASIVCLPNGLNKLPLTILPSLERFKKVILWFGKQLWDCTRQFSYKLGEKRCLLVRPSVGHDLPRDITVARDFKTVINNARPIWHKSITTFAALRADVLFELQNVDKVEGIKWRRYPALNKILKGHRRGELTVLTGPTGSGKTTFISEYSLDLAMQGVNTLWGSFEIQNSRLARTMLQQMAGLPLNDDLQLFNHWADKFEGLPIYFMTFHGQQSLKVVMEAIEHATYVHDLSHVIIDNLQFMMGISEESKVVDRFWKQDTIISAFRTFATQKNCHVTLVIHPRKERSDLELTTSSIFGGAKASQEADNVLIIQDKRLIQLRGKKYLQVLKNRYSGDLGVIPLDFDKDSLSYAPKKQPRPKPT